MTAMQSAKRKPKVSKNKKKGWKRTDVEDVDDFLEDKRLTERIGGPASAKEDGQLFFVDKAEDVRTVPGTKRRREPKPLRCHALLQPDPTIAPASVPQRRNMALLKYECPKVREKIEKGLYTAKGKLERNISKFQRKKIRREKREIIRQNRSNRTGTRDLWGGDDILAKPGNMEEHFWNITKRRRVNVPASTRRKPSALPAVVVAHPGASYNPTFEDHQDLIEQAVNVELKKKKELTKIKKAMEDHFPLKKDALSHDARWMQEMSFGINVDTNMESESEEEEEEVDPDKPPPAPPVKPTKEKTKKQRKRKRILKVQEHIARKKIEARERRNEFNRIKSIKKEITKIKAKEKENAQLRYVHKEKDKSRTKRVGVARFQEMDIPVKLSDELEGSLRKLQPEGSLLMDRFKNLQRRNMIEAKSKPEEKRRRPSKRRRVKTYEVKASRDITL